ncbi:hypothetical protein ACFSC3_10195 [Sphingomonas floccifaciens]|uniref:MarR family transcriptional regulator n=1 Tax=Sphingomonas floccifaciens TaxID=1844115 RepID=A0ABW4NEK2_9SPHN
MPYLSKVVLTDTVPVRRLTRLLAEMQVTINAAGLRLFDGDMDRFVIFSLVVREGLSPRGDARPISAHSLSISLNRSFETVRRHVNALIDAGYCVRVRGGVTAAPGLIDRPDVDAVVKLSNDAFVRFVEDFADKDAAAPAPEPLPPYHISVGVSGAVDTLLATVETNRGLHGDWLDLALFSTTLCANVRRHACDPQAIGLPMCERHAVRPSVIARALGLAETTVRRRVGRLIRPGGSMVRVRSGLMVSQEFLKTSTAAATTAATLEHVRREIRKAVARGFPIDAPSRAYAVGRPAETPFA